MEVVVNKIKESVCYLHDSNDNFIGYIDSEIQLLDVLVQISTLGVDGYYVVYFGEDIDEETGEKVKYLLPITKGGKVHKAPKGFFDKTDEYLRILTGFKNIL